MVCILLRKNNAKSFQWRPLVPITGANDRKSRNCPMVINSCLKLKKNTTKCLYEHAQFFSFWISNMETAIHTRSGTKSKIISLLLTCDVDLGRNPVLKGLLWKLNETGHTNQYCYFFMTHYIII